MAARSAEGITISGEGTEGASEGHALCVLGLVPRHNARQQKFGDDYD
ncbi:hypothetical protein ACFE33_12145 [Falsihalocynthiibacter sp. SS001]